MIFKILYGFGLTIEISDRDSWDCYTEHSLPKTLMALFCGGCPSLTIYHDNHDGYSYRPHYRFSDNDSLKHFNWVISPFSNIDSSYDDIPF